MKAIGPDETQSWLGILEYRMSNLEISDSTVNNE
jgi:hypothetical protein